MYPKQIVSLTGLCIVLLSACTSVHQAKNAVDFSLQPASSIAEKKSIGPPEYIPETAVTEKIVERGGRYVYMPPSYTRSKEEMGTAAWSAPTLQKRAERLKRFAAANNFDTTVAFFIDMQVKSGKNRFLVVNLANYQVVKKGLVAHGKGNERFTFNRKFSNGEGSNCTSLGVYKIGKAYNGSFGLSYKLYGLDKTNSNAFKRYVVLHAMGSIPEEESNWPITQTEGCPAVSPAFLSVLSPILDNAGKNVLLYIYYGSAQ